MKYFRWKNSSCRYLIIFPIVTCLPPTTRLSLSNEDKTNINLQWKESTKVNRIRKKNLTIATTTTTTTDFLCFSNSSEKKRFFPEANAIPSKVFQIVHETILFLRLHFCSRCEVRQYFILIIEILFLSNLLFTCLFRRPWKGLKLNIDIIKYAKWTYQIINSEIEATLFFFFVFIFKRKIFRTKKCLDAFSMFVVLENSNKCKVCPVLRVCKSHFFFLFRLSICCWTKRSTLTQVVVFLTMSL